MVDRIETGIPGFDRLIDGGLPNRSVTLISGGTGTGKTTFCTEFLFHGVQNGETCLFITTQELPEEILGDAEEFGWDFAAYEDERLFHIEYLSPSERSKYLKQDVMEAIGDMDPDRIVIDSISVFGTYVEGDKTVRDELTYLLQSLREEDAVTLLTAEIPDQESGRFSRHGIAEFVVDGVVKLEFVSIGQEAFGNIEVRKMRKTPIEKGQFDLHMDEDGLRVGEETLEIT